MSTPDERNEKLDEIAESVAGPGRTAEPDEPYDKDTRDDPNGQNLHGGDQTGDDAHP